MFVMNSEQDKSRVYHFYYFKGDGHISYKFEIFENDEEEVSDKEKQDVNDEVRRIKFFLSQIMVFILCF